MLNTVLPSISALQEEIITEFKTLEGDQESILGYIMDLGDQLAPMDELYKNENHTIRGCLAKVWLTYTKQYDRLFFEADSNTAITKGLISLLLRVLSGQKIDDIINANLYFVEKIGMIQLIGSQRAGGFASIVKEIKLIAIAQKVTHAQESKL